MRVKFSEKMEDTLNKKSDNATLMRGEKYNEVVRRVKELQEPVSAKTNKDYSYLRKYDLQEVTVDNSIVWKLRKKGTDKTVNLHTACSLISGNLKYAERTRQSIKK